MTKYNQIIISLFFAIIILLLLLTQSTFSNHEICNCKGYKGIGGPCYAGKGGDGKNCPLICRCKEQFIGNLKIEKDFILF